MNLELLRRLQSKLLLAFLAAASLVLASCGGGGAAGSPATGGALALLPATSTIYAGVPYTFNITGGHGPYLVTSSEQTLIALNFTTSSNTFQIVANNPGVIDVGLDPNAVPQRSANITVRDSLGTTITNTYNVLQNFFTGYSEFYSSTCATGSGTTPPQACSGSDSIVTLVPVSNGTLYGGRTYQLDRVRGDYSFVVEDPTVTPQQVDRIRINTDQVGRGIVRIRVNAAAPTQLATFTITDILTGVTTNAVFLIIQQPTADTITTVPSTLTFTGSLSSKCGTGNADIFVFGGTPPYTLSASSGLTISPSTVSASGGKFTVTVGAASPPCPAGTTITVTDSRGTVALVSVTISAGSGTGPAIAASPAAVTLSCGQFSQVVVIGGAGGINATSTHPRVTATISGNTLTLSRLTGDATPPAPYPLSGSVVLTDGNSLVTIAVTLTAATCP